MDLPEQFRKSCVLVAAAVYISIENMHIDDAERVIAAHLEKIFEIKYSTDNIIIVESYVDRDDSMAEWNRLIEDAKTGRYQVILTCGDISERFGLDVPVIDVLKYESSN